ncbi:MAG TPA: hypothetical protein DEA55_09400, partial [Rhodospirillaceae bacterium]|nr:hypothetical protein [Rhodospirillaceae bacterium]
MARKKRIASDAGPVASPYGTWLSSYAPQMAVSVAGIILTLATFVLLNAFVQGQTRDEYSRFTQDAADVLIGGASDLRRSVQMAATILSLPSEYTEKHSRAELAEKVKDVTPDLNHFDQVLWLYETRPGVWQFNNIYQRLSSGQQSISPDKTLISHIIKAGYFKDDKVYTATDFPGFEKAEQSKGNWAHSLPFAVVKAVKAGDLSSGIVIGFSRIESILGDTWLEKSAVLSRITVNEMDKRIYDVDYSSNGDRKSMSREHTYEFMIGESKWSATMKFFKVEHMSVLEKVPYMVVAFGVILTMVVVMYVSNNQKQSNILTGVNRELEHKNFELKTEVEERERLNKAIRRAEKENRGIINSVTDIIFQASTDGKILFLNNAWHKVTGFDPKQSMG